MALSGGKGNSRASTSSSSTTLTETTNNIDNRVLTSDFGAVQGGTDVATAAIGANSDLAGDAIGANSDLASDAIATARDITRDALSFTGDAARISSNLSEATTQRSLDFAGDLVDGVQRANANGLELFAGLVGQTIDASKTLARDSAEANSATLSDAIAGFKSLAIQNSETSDDKITRVLGYALAAVAAIVILPAVFKGGGKAVIA